MWQPGPAQQQGADGAASGAGVDVSGGLRVVAPALGPPGRRLWHRLGGLAAAVLGLHLLVLALWPGTPRPAPHEATDRAPAKAGGPPGARSDGAAASSATAVQVSARSVAVAPKPAAPPPPIEATPQPKPQPISQPSEGATRGSGPSTTDRTKALPIAPPQAVARQPPAMPVRVNPSTPGAPATDGGTMAGPSVTTDAGAIEAGATAPSAEQPPAALAAQVPRPTPAPTTSAPPQSTPVTQAALSASARAPDASAARAAPPPVVLAADVPRPGPDGRKSTPPPPTAPASTSGAPLPPPTRLPPSAELHYAVHRGPIAGEGTLLWQRRADGYSASLEASLPVIGRIFSQTSSGGFDRWGLAPLRHTEKRLRRSERALSMTRDAPGGPLLSFSASAARLPLPPGAQDRVSWLIQLAALVAARAGAGVVAPASAGDAAGGFELDVASVNGDLRHWSFRPITAASAGAGAAASARGTTADERTSPAGGTPGQGLVQLERRPPPGVYDTIAQVWLDPARHGWPVRIVLSDAGQEPLELRLTRLIERE